ncbi:MAG: hypothetical protein AB8B87_20975 [Granulosicoccus sp.]
MRGNPVLLTPARGMSSDLRLRGNDVQLTPVIPAEAGIYPANHWIPACAGMTVQLAHARECRSTYACTGMTAQLTPARE